MKKWGMYRWTIIHCITSLGTHFLVLYSILPFDSICTRQVMLPKVPSKELWPTEPLMNKQASITPTANGLNIFACSVAQTCLTPCYPMDCSPPESSAHGIGLARILEWVAISSSRVSSWPKDDPSVSWGCCICSVTSVLSDSLWPYRLAHQSPLSMGFSRQEYWSGLPGPPPGNLPNPGIELLSACIYCFAGGFFPTEPPGKPAEYLFPHSNSCQTPNLQSDGIRAFCRFLICEDGTLMNGNTFYKRNRPHRSPYSLPHVMAQEKASSLQARRGPSLESTHVDTLIPDFQPPEA